MIIIAVKNDQTVQMMFVQVAVVNIVSNMLAHQITEGWGWPKWMDWSGKEMKTEYLPYIVPKVNIYPERVLLKMLKKKFPKIKPLDARRAIEIAKDKGYAALRD